ncbi:hypothetical protein LSUE1_G003710 [Lachnellula suecica]|uniref:Uncharacterized protein n=1 Tax=Lachnellula suecica TaxID=602035 RepID=A0A8T9C6M5_9HELO|nr:hypothetical protein LSUE1_G003710 [Lachnellula suecica]
MLFASFATLLALSGVSSAASFSKRDTVTTTLFGYGSGTNGAPVFYADGLAYIGQTGFSTSNGTQTNITFTADTTSTTTAWPIAANSSTVTFNETLNFYIIPTNGSFAQAGFSTDANLPSGAVNTGFTWFGTAVAYAQSDSNYELMFWAANTTEDGIYGLYWNQAGTPLDGAFPVTLKVSPPTETT